MSDRLKTMRRIVAVQAQAKRLATWKLATLEQRKATLEAAQRELDGFVDGSNLVGPLATVALSQSNRLSRREAVAEHDRAQQVTVLREAEMRHKLAERVTDVVAAEERASDERRLLERLIEQFVGRTAASD